MDGSWFIQAVTRVFREHWDKMELMQMMTLVSKVVAYDFQSCTGWYFLGGGVIYFRIKSIKSRRPRKTRCVCVVNFI